MPENFPPPPPPLPPPPPIPAAPGPVQPQGGKKAPVGLILGCLAFFICGVLGLLLIGGLTYQADESTGGQPSAPVARTTDALFGVAGDQEEEAPSANGAASQPQMANPEPRAAAGPYLTLVELVSKDPGFSASELTGKWGAGQGAAIIEERFSHQAGNVEYYDVIRKGEFGESFIFTFLPDGNYRFMVLASTHYGYRSQSCVTETGRFRVEGDELVCEPSGYNGRMFSGNKVSPHQGSDAPARRYRLYQGTVRGVGAFESSITPTNSALILEGPYAEHLCHFDSMNKGVFQYILQRLP